MTKKRSEPRTMSTPTPPSPRPVTDAEQRRQVARTPGAFRPDERQPQPTVRPHATTLKRAEQELRGRLEADTQRTLIVAPRSRESEPSLTSGAPRHSQLRAPKTAVRQDHRGPDADLRGPDGLGAQRQGHARGDPGRGDHGPSEARRRR